MVLGWGLSAQFYPLARPLGCFAGPSLQPPSLCLPLETLGHFWLSRSVPAPLPPPSPKQSLQSTLLPKP